MANNIPTLNGNVELAKITLMLQAIHNAQAAVKTIYGEGEYYSSNFSSPWARDVFYKLNDWACELYDMERIITGEEF